MENRVRLCDVETDGADVEIDDDHDVDDDGLAEWFDVAVAYGRFGMLYYWQLYTVTVVDSVAAVVVDVVRNDRYVVLLLYGLWAWHETIGSTDWSKLLFSMLLRRPMLFDAAEGEHN